MRTLKIDHLYVSQSYLQSSTIITPVLLIFRLAYFITIRPIHLLILTIPPIPIPTLILILINPITILTIILTIHLTIITTLLLTLTPHFITLMALHFQYPITSNVRVHALDFLV